MLESWFLIFTNWFFLFCQLRHVRHLRGVFFVKIGNFSHKDLHLRYFSGFYMRLWSPLFLVNFYCRLGSFFSKVTLIIHAQCVWVRFPIRTFETISTATNLSSKMHSRGMADLHNKNVICLKKIWYSVLKCRSSNTL